ncbi:MAG: arginine--tRNA ligase [Candidatus Babeliaceae bacterium]|nr:arginine--tRNA ligase [Candidatus Babeliaceae bacterium]
MNTLNIIIKAFKEHVLQVYPSVTLPFDVTLNVDQQRQQFGDLSSNAAMIYAKELKSNPRAVAHNILKDFNNPLVNSSEIAGPGFINITLNPDFFSNILNELHEYGDAFFKLEKNYPLKKFNIEFVSANPTGPLHLGHGRGGIIGDVLGTILRFLGHTVTKEFYSNDAGNQIEKLGASFKIRCLQKTGQSLEIPEDGYHGEYLKELADKAYAELGDKLATQPESFYAAYAKDYLLQKIKETLAAYGIEYDIWFSEKSLHDSGAITKGLELIRKNGYLYEKDGAHWLKSTAFGDDKDRVLKKATGELTYVSADVAYLEDKIERGAEKLIMVLGQDHHSYVVRLKAVLQALGKDPHMLDVILYQLVTIKESGQQVRLSKRAGKIISLEDITHTVGKDVARFFYLHRKADAHLEFDIDLALSRTEENPVYYIQYAYVRTLSMLEKADSMGIHSITAADAKHVTEKESLLIKKIVALARVLEDISQHYQTHLLTYYLHDLAQLFSTYYGNTKVIDMQNIPVTRGRLLVIMQLRDTFNLCLRLLGLSAPDKM